MVDTRRPEIVFRDPWLRQTKGKRTLPKDLRFVCAYHLDIGPDLVDEAAFLRKAADRDELWIAAGFTLSTLGDIAVGDATLKCIEREANFGLGCAFAASPIADELSACLNLLDHLFRARLGFYWPRKLSVAGIVKEADFNKLLGQIDRELKDNAEKARQKETEIIRVARELTLCPEPTGKDPVYWQARCPEMNHPIYINSVDNSFFCGWCKRKGGIEELRAFAEERKGRAKNSLHRMP